MLEVKDKIALLGIIATFIIAVVNLVYIVVNSRKTIFVSTRDGFTLEVDRVPSRQNFRIYSCYDSNPQS